MPIKTEGVVTVDVQAEGAVPLTVEVPFSFTRNDVSVCAAVVVTEVDGVAIGVAIDQVLMRNLADLDVHMAQIFVRRLDGTLAIANVRQPAPTERGAHIIDVDNVTMEPFG